MAYGPFQLTDKQPGDLWEIPYTTFSSHFPHLHQSKSFSTSSRLSLKKGPDKKKLKGVKEKRPS